MKEYSLKTKRPKFFHCLLNIIKWIIKSIFKVFFRLEIIGGEKIPMQGKIILCSNHISYADPVIITACFPRIIFFMSKIEILKGWFLTSFFRYFNTFPVKRNKFDRQAVRYSLKVLADNEVLGIFPEGTRSPEGIIRAGQKGVGLISLMGQSNILPVAISGTNKIIQKPHKRLFFPKVKLIFGDILDVTKIIEDHEHSKAVDVIITKTMDSIKSLYEKIS